MLHKAGRSKPALDDRSRELRVTELGQLLEAHAAGKKVLSLDCFDTLLWRDTATPIDVFYDLQRHPAFSRIGLNAKLRASSETRARNLKRVRTGRAEVGLSDIYAAGFPELTPAELAELAAAELEAEMRACYALPQTVELIRTAKQRGLRVVIVSDTYFSEAELRKLLDATLPEGVLPLIDNVFCSSVFGRGKADGLFKDVLERLGVRAERVLHVGDNRVADFTAPTSLGISAFHLRHHDDRVLQLMRLQGSAMSVLCPEVRQEASLPAPFRAIVASNAWDQNPAEQLGYSACGPLMYSFARFVLDELEALKQDGKRAKLVFLMRDAHLPKLVCDAISGAESGQAVAISRFASNAASFRNRADVEGYLAASAGSKRFEAMARQLLLPDALAKNIVVSSERAKRPIEDFTRQVLEPRVLAVIFERSEAYLKRLARYLERKVGLAAGDTLVFVDLGYEGTAQRRLEPVFRDELGVEVVGRYLIVSRTPGWERARRGLMDPSWCDDRAISAIVPYVAMIEDLCTSDDASVLDYDEDGNSLHGERTLAAEQYERIQPVQSACVRFARDAEAFFTASGRRPTLEALRRSALGDVGRLLFFTAEHEVDYLEGFRLDMNLATLDSFELFNREQGLDGLRRRGLFFMERNQKSLRMNYPVELRSAGIELTMALLAQHRYGLEFARSDTSLRRESVPVMITRGGDASMATLDAEATHDGYFALLVPVGRCELQFGVLFGQRYEWVQIESVELIKARALFQDFESEHTEDLSGHVRVEDMHMHGPGLFQCVQSSAFLFVTPDSSSRNRERFVCRIVFRPLLSRQAPAA